jgi:hypothetical protein
MIRRDWFKRQIDIVVQALGLVLGLKQKGEIQASIGALEAAVLKAFGMSGPLALGLPLDEFISLACRGESPSPELLSALADFFREWGGLLAAQGRGAEAAAAADRAEALRQLANGYNASR